jgi:hypothetical protein
MTSLETHIPDSLTLRKYRYIIPPVLPETIQFRMQRFVVSGLVFILCSCHSPGIRGIFTPLPPRSGIARLELNEFQDDGTWRMLAETTQGAHIDRFLETVRNIQGVWHPEGIHFGTSHQIVVEDSPQKVIAVYCFDTNRIAAKRGWQADHHGTAQHRQRSHRAAGGFRPLTPAVA